MGAGIVACSFCTGVRAAAWVPDPATGLAVLVVAGIAVAIMATITSGRRSRGLSVVAAAVLLVAPAAVVLAGQDVVVGGVETARRADSADGTWRVRCGSPFLADEPTPRSDHEALWDACARATSGRRTATIGLTAVVGAMVVGGLSAAAPRPRKDRAPTTGRVERSLR